MTARRSRTSDAAPTAPVTVVVATLNRREELRGTLGRLTRLPERPPVVVVDNGSADGTAAMVAARFPQVTLVRLRENRGACARNIGVRLARTPYVAFSDDDSWWEPYSLARAADLFDRHARLGLLVARLRTGEAGRTDPVSLKMASAPLGRDADLPGPSVLGFPACAAVVRRTAFLSVGGFDALLFFGGEESLLAVDLAAASWGLAYVSAVQARHLPSPLREAPARRWSLHQRNDVLVHWMRLPLRDAARRTATLAGRAVRDPAAARALCGLLRRLPGGIARRRPVPRSVVRGLAVLGELR
ncbi:glycosyltransferase family 2 protein [Streptomyces mexicanus]|uniref:glycosyltransferase family 2 protein n=1 Tax=Streptomyces mexicanus TaxID=178566 RepID=UPI003696DB46